MAMIFELSVNFGQNIEAARSAAPRNLSSRPTPAAALQAGSHRIPLHRPEMTIVNAREPESMYIELSIIPVGVSWRLRMDGTVPRFSLTAAELTELGAGLYRLLETFDGYIAAAVGWDVDSLVDPEEIKGTDELKDGAFSGLVLCEALRDELGLARNPNYVQFRPGYVWVPYRGEKPSWLAADGPRRPGSAVTARPAE
jgi:hypothetical protein